LGLLFINLSIICRHKCIEDSVLVLRFVLMNLANEYGSIKLFSNSSLKRRISLSIAYRVLILMPWVKLFSCTLKILGRSFSAAKNITY